MLAAGVKLEQLKCSDWFGFQTLDFNIIPPEPGVYEIGWAIGEKSQSIYRANGMDNIGLLYIGVSVASLRNRIKIFCRSIKYGSRGHTAGRTYFTYDYGRKFRPEQLHVRWATLFKWQCEETESKLLNEYVTMFLDKPPLNISIKRAKKIHFDKSWAVTKPLARKKAKVEAENSRS
jgi:hypothetical protein